MNDLVISLTFQIKLSNRLQPSFLPILSLQKPIEHFSSLTPLDFIESSIRVLEFVATYVATMNAFVKLGIILPLSLTGVLRLLHEVHFKGGTCKSDKRLDGKTVLITGW